MKVKVLETHKIAGGIIKGTIEFEAGTSRMATVLFEDAENVYITTDEPNTVTPKPLHVLIDGVAYEPMRYGHPSLIGAENETQ